MQHFLAFVKDLRMDGVLRLPRSSILTMLIKERIGKSLQKIPLNFIIKKAGYEKEFSLILLFDIYLAFIKNVSSSTSHKTFRTP